MVHRGFINKYFKKTLDLRLPTLNSKILRINKTDYVVRKHGLIQASNMMQNKVSTILKHYTAQREEVSNKQITDFFSTLNERVFENNNVQVETIIGQCSKTEEIVINNEFQLIVIISKHVYSVLITVAILINKTY